MVRGMGMGLISGLNKKRKQNKYILNILVDGDLLKYILT